MRYKKTLLLLFMSIFTLSNLFGQRFEIGMNLGGASYLGDLNQFNPVKISGLSGGAFAKVNIDPHWGVGLYFNTGKIKGSDANSADQQFKDRNLSFYTPIHELAIIGDFNLFNLFDYGPVKRRFTPYLFAGLGMAKFEPKAEYKDKEYKLRLYNTEGQQSEYKSIVLTFPYGAGVKYRMTETLTFFSQIGYRSPSTDYLDDVSGVYPEKNVWPNANTRGISKALSDRSGEETGVYIGDAYTQRGDFRKRDNYMFVGIGISYTFVSQKCFTF